VRELLFFGSLDGVLTGILLIPVLGIVKFSLLFGLEKVAFADEPD
jgi:hypothetical protein